MSVVAPAPPRTSELVAPSRHLRRRLATWGGACVLALFSLTLILFVYYRPLLRGQWQAIGIDGDAWFYTYQLSRVAELDGRWWLLGNDPLVGAPYPSGAAKHPGLYEGLDLLLLGSFTGRLLSPEVNFHVLVVMLLLLNALIAGSQVRRLTGSWTWAALAVVLITVNFSTAMRVGSAPHLFKYGWALLAAWAFWRYLEAPTVRRGLVLGLAAAWLLACSFYLGFLFGVVLAVWWLGCLMAGKVQRPHALPTVAAGSAFALVALALTFPVWTISRHTLLADGNYFQHQRAEVWWYGSELWQYLVSPLSSYGQELQQAKHSTSMEGWHYPGLTVLLALGLYLAARLRGQSLRTRYPGFLDCLVGLTGLLVLLSLTGGPSGFLYDLMKGFRCYGRCGQIAIGLWAVAAPVIWCLLLRRLRWKPAGIALGSIVVLLTVWDARQVAQGYARPPVAASPAWSSWLARQDADVRLAAFAPLHGDFNVLWHWDNLRERQVHRHTTLNGCEYALLQGDLRLLGAAHDTMNHDGLRFVATLGYNAFAFNDEYLALHPWIATLPWLDLAAVEGGWHLYRTNDRTPRFATATAADLVRREPQPPAPRRVPPGALLTEQLTLTETVVNPSTEVFQLAWADATGKRLGKPLPALYQHVFVPDQPAFSVVSPFRAGVYQLLFLDASGNTLASRPYEVVDGLETFYRAQAARSPLANSLPLATDKSTQRINISVENRTRYYVQSRVDTGHLSPSTLAQPELREPALGDVVLLVRPAGVSKADRQLIVPLPADVPPQGHLRVAVAREQLIRACGEGPVTVHVARFPAEPAEGEALELHLEPRE